MRRRLMAKGFSLVPRQVRERVGRVPWLYTTLDRLVGRLLPRDALSAMEFPAGPMAGYRMELYLREMSILRGHYEPRVVEVLQRIVRNGAVAYDIGAFIGYFALLLARLCGEGGGRASQSHLEGGHVRDDPWFNPVSLGGSAKVEVPAVHLDDFVFRQSYPPPQVVKLHAEGFEAEVLEGSRAILREARPFIICAIHRMDTWPGIFRLLREHDYALFDLDNRMAPMASPDGFAALSHYIAGCPQEARDSLGL